MDHVFIIKTLPGKTHASRAELIGNGCRDYHVRDWLRRGAIPSEWWQAVAAVHPAGEDDTLRQLIGTAGKRRAPVDRRKAGAA